MKATQRLRNLGQSIWLDNITRDLLTSGTLKRYIDELSVTLPDNYIPNTVAWAVDAPAASRRDEVRPSHRRGCPRAAPET
jgi:hypothetical protein